MALNNANSTPNPIDSIHFPSSYRGGSDARTQKISNYSLRQNIIKNTSYVRPNKDTFGEDVGSGSLLNVVGNGKVRSVNNGSSTRNYVPIKQKPNLI